MIKDAVTIDSIVALATPPGIGAIAVIRISGKDSFSICNKVFYNARGKQELDKVNSHSTIFGTIRKDSQIVDEVLTSVFRGPRSFTGEDTVEISCHGSPFIQQQLMQLFLENGARLATPGEFTMRAFFNGKMDLSQAEAVADVIAADSASAHQVALQQMRGGFSKEISYLREQLINFASLIELELDFSEEDVEFADRTQLTNLLCTIENHLSRLVDSFRLGNVIKNGIPVAIIGEPNVGKSTLLNVLLNEEKAIVSEIPGTTRDVIEDVISLQGIKFRFIDTAGLRVTTDKIEALGIGRSYEKATKASIILFIFDSNTATVEEVNTTINSFKEKVDISDKQLMFLFNKIDQVHEEELKAQFNDFENSLFLSAATGYNIELLKEKLVSLINEGRMTPDDIVVTNVRHHQALKQALETVKHIQSGLENKITGDFLAVDIRKCLHHLGEITGTITTDDLLGNIFSKFCIGK